MTEHTTNPAEQIFSLKQLADELGFHASSIRKAVARRGFVTCPVTPGKNKPLYLSHEDALAFRKKIMDERNGRTSMASIVTPKRQGGVYFIEVPSYDGVNRVKIGWSESFADRISSYRTIVPDLRVRAFWPTSDSWCQGSALKNYAKSFHSVFMRVQHLTELSISWNRRLKRSRTGSPRYLIEPPPNGSGVFPLPLDGARPAHLN